MGMRAAFWGSLLLAAMMVPAAAAPVTSPEQVDERLAEAKELMLEAPGRTIAVAKEVETRLRRPPPLPEGKRRLATALWLHGEALVRLDKLDQAIKPLGDALALAHEAAPNSKLEGDIRLSRAWISSMRGDVAAALAEYHRAHAIFHALNETRSEAIALISIADLYRKARDYRSALRYAQRAEEAGTTDATLLFFVHNNVGATLADMGRNQDALVQYRRALEDGTRVGSDELQATALANIARTQLRLGDLPQMRSAIVRGIQMRPRDPISLARFASIAAEAARKGGDLQAARREITRAFANFDVANTTIAQRDAHETAYRLYKRTGDLDQALAHLEALKRLDDQATSLAASANTALMGARFDFKSQELRIAKLKADELQRSIELERTQRESQQRLFGVAAFAGIIVLTLLAAFGLAMRRKRNQLAVTNTELERALAARTEFLASTSHEIRTPLNGILGMTQVMLADPTAPAAMRERLEVVKGAGLTMRALVDDILDVAKMETGRFTVAPHAMNLRVTLEEVTRLWADQAGQRGIAFRVDLSDCPSAVEGDAARIRQIVFNLLSNAIKFTGKGGVDVRTCVLAAPDGSERIRIAVRDTGIGIPEDKLAAIFEAFRQVDASTTRTYGGTGLGLAICRNLARTMGGDVLVESEIARGSTFTLELPVRRIAEPEPVAEVVEVEPVTLVIDRNPISRIMVKALVEKQGAVSAVGSLDEGIAAIEAGGVARIAVDETALGAVEERGVALARLVQAAADVPLVVLGTGEGLRVAGGEVALVAKPVAPAALLAALFTGRADYCAPGEERGLVSHAA